MASLKRSVASPSSYSLIGHAVVFILLGWILPRAPQAPHVPPQEIEVVSMKRMSPQRGGVGEGARAQEALPLSRLAPRVDLSDSGVFSNPSPDPDSIESHPEGLSGRDAYEIASEMSLQAESTLYPFLKIIHQRIESELRYPHLFIQLRREARVSIQFELSRRGKRVSPFFLVSSNDRFMEVYLLRLLAKTLRLEVSQKDWVFPEKEERLRVVANFDFSIYHTEEVVPDQQPSIHKNTLRFRRILVRPLGIVKAQQVGADGSAALLSIPHIIRQIFGDPSELKERLYDRYSKYEERESFHL